MRAIRYCWVFVLALIPVLSSAQSIPAQDTYEPALQGYRLMGGLPLRADKNEAIQDMLSLRQSQQPAYAWTYDMPNANYVQFYRSGTYYEGYTLTPSLFCADGSAVVNGQCAVKTCPSGYTLNGTMCEPPPPQCPPDKPTQLADGTCVDACAAFAGVEELVYFSTDPAVYDGSCESVGSQMCGFLFSKAVPNEGYVFAGMAALPAFGIYKVGTGQSCSVSKDPNQPPEPPNLPEKKPPCDATEGVLTSTNGRVMCVPEGTPSARKPEVEEREKRETFPDGTEKVTKTTKTRDPKTGAESTHTESTSNGGQSGSSGTSTSTDDKKAPDGVTDEGDGDGNGGDGDGDCEGDDCGEGEDPDFTPPEGGDLYESSDRTIRNVIDDFVNAVSAAPAIQAAQSFFVPGSMPASCGGMSTNVPMIDVTVSLDEYLCGESAQTIIAIAGVIVLAIAAFAAFRIGFL